MSSYDDELMKDKSHTTFLERVKTAQSVTIPPELFEQMFLAPKTAVKGDLRSTFGNPTPVALGGFLLCTTPLSMVLFGWKGAGGLGAANVGTYFYFGGLLLLLGGVGEFLLGNSFPMIVFTTFGAFWFTFGATLVPAYNAYGAYATDPTNIATGLESPTFYNTFAFFLLAMCLLDTVYLIASIRTNIVFFLIFLILLPCFGCLTGAFFALGQGAAASAQTLQHAGAGLLLVLTLLGWYIFLSLVLMSVDFPFMLPLGDLSTVIKGHTDRQKAAKEKV